MGESVWSFVGIQVRNVKTDLCDCEQRGKTKEYVSINNLNYRTPEKSHANEELVGYRVAF
jgi:hypothetical protein